MAKEKTTIEKNLLTLRAMFGKDICVTLIVRQGSIDFLSCNDKRHYLQSYNITEPDDGPPAPSPAQAKEDFSKDYIQ